MAFKVDVKPSAKKDLYQAIEYYEWINHKLAKRLYDEFLELNALLTTNPHFPIKYKYVRTYKLKSFPYLVHFVINEKTKTLSIIVIIFGKQLTTDFEFRVSET
jgi:mRNA-degrading endonuclease RelE of RelBE toxin-antitoxin system